MHIDEGSDLHQIELSFNRLGEKPSLTLYKGTDYFSDFSQKINNYLLSRNISVSSIHHMLEDGVLFRSDGNPVFKTSSDFPTLLETLELEANYFNKKNLEAFSLLENRTKKRQEDITDSLIGYKYENKEGTETIHNIYNINQWSETLYHALRPSQQLDSTDTKTPKKGRISPPRTHESKAPPPSCYKPNPWT